MNKPFLSVAFLCLSCFLAGCNQIQLHRTSLQQARTALDIQYQQVLDNLALIQTSPAALPTYAMIDQGAVTVDTTASLPLVAGWTKTAVASTALSGSGTRHFSGNWILKPLNGGDRLGAMRLVYQVATGQRNRSDPAWKDCAEYLKTYGVDIADPCQVPDPGWYACGSKHDVPKHAQFVGRCGDTYVWVVPGGEDNLSRLTLTILDIAWKQRQKPATGGQFTQITEHDLKDRISQLKNPATSGRAEEKLRDLITQITSERDRAQGAAAAGEQFTQITEHDFKNMINRLKNPATSEDAEEKLRDFIRQIISERDRAHGAAAVAPGSEAPFNPVQSMVPIFGS